MSDFPKAVALVSEGFCPVCRCPMVVSRDEDDASARATCTRCDVGWTVSIVEDRPILIPSRKLTANEVRFLYDRNGEI